MYFYVDESGHTGPNLFDPAQPTLYYGVLSSRVNLDLLAQPYLESIKNQLGVKRLHAVDLELEQLALVAPTILAIDKKFRLTFDCYRVVKADYALTSFFDQVFDSGLNPVIDWSLYYSPLRYVLLLKLHTLFDEETLKIAWSARIEGNPEKAQKKLIEACQIIKERAHSSLNEKSNKLIIDALQWVQNNPQAVDYKVSSKGQALQISPNLIGFQYVLTGIASRLQTQSKKMTSKIIVDQQSQFNKAQQTLQNVYLSFPKNQTFEMGPLLPVLDLRGMPDTPLIFAESKNSAGLQLVDFFLGIFKYHFEGKALPSALTPIINKQLARGKTDELSMRSISYRAKVGEDALKAEYNAFKNKKY